MTSVGVTSDWTHLAPTRIFEIPAQVAFFVSVFVCTCVGNKKKKAGTTSCQRGQGEDNTKNEDIILAARWIGTPRDPPQHCDWLCVCPQPCDWLCVCRDSFLTDTASSTCEEGLSIMPHACQAVKNLI